jgi:hypothetical protein
MGKALRLILVCALCLGVALAVAYGVRIWLAG